MRRAATALAAVALPLTACGGDSEEPAAEIAGITCSKTGLTVTPRVQAGPEGDVHVEADVSEERGVGLTINGQRVRGGVDMQLSPGFHRVKCSDGTGGSMEASFEVTGN